MLEVKNLSYKHLFDKLSFSLSSGEWLQIVGQNGAGKTTLLKMLNGLIAPTEGQVHWSGKSIAYNGHLHALKSTLTVFENLLFARDLWNSVVSHETMHALLKNMNLTDFENKFCGHLSSGQKKRLSLATMVVKNACLWFLDEPLTSLDTEGKRYFTELMKQHLKQGGMVMLSTHDPICLGGGYTLEIHQPC